MIKMNLWEQSPAVVKKCPIIFVDFGIEKCESGLTNSIRNVPSGSMKYARML
jgi:hypothetical protein